MDTKYRLETFAFYDHNGIATHLEKMASKGWMVEEMGNYLWKYRRMEPKRLHFAVTYLPEASMFTVGPPDEQLLLRDYCEAAGWKQAVSNAWMQVFYSEDPDPVPLETDAVIQVANINAAAWKTHLCANWLLFGLSSFLAFVCIVLTVEIGGDLWSSPGWLLPLAAVLGVVLLSVVELAAYYIWYDKAERMAREEGVLYPTKSRRGLQWTIAALALAAFLWDTLQQRDAAQSLLPVILPILLVGGCRFLGKRFKLSEKLNRTLVVLAVILYMLAARWLWYGRG